MHPGFGSAKSTNAHHAHAYEVKHQCCQHNNTAERRIIHNAKHLLPEIPPRSPPRIIRNFAGKKATATASGSANGTKRPVLASWPFTQWEWHTCLCIQYIIAYIRTACTIMLAHTHEARAQPKVMKHAPADRAKQSDARSAPFVMGPMRGITSRTVPIAMRSLQTNHTRGPNTSPPPTWVSIHAMINIHMVPRQVSRAFACVA